MNGPHGMEGKGRSRFHLIHVFLVLVDESGRHAGFDAGCLQAIDGAGFFMAWVNAK